MAQSGIYVGKQRGKRRRGVTIQEKDLSTHVHILGRSGMGKSWLIRQMLSVDIEHNDRYGTPGLCLIDPAGDLFDFAFDFVSRCKQARKRLHLIDLSQRDYFPGLNYLDQPGNMDVDSQARTIIEGVHKAFGHSDQGAKIEVERYFKLLLVPFILERFTFDEIEPFVASQQFRDSVLLKLWEEKKITPAVIAAWQHLNRQPPKEQAGFLRGVLNREIHFISLATESATSNIFSQDHSTVDFKQAMDESRIVLCKLPRGAGFDSTLLDLVGIILVDKIMQAGYQREPNVEPYFRVYIDEFARFVSNRDIEEGLNEMRKFHVSFVLSHQNLEQLKAKDLRLYKSVKANCNVRILFSVDDEDAEVAAKSMFTAFLARDQVQDEIRTQMITPRETTRTITSEAEVDSYMEALSEAAGGSRMTSSGSTQQSSTGMSLAYAGDGQGNFLLLPDPASTVRSEQKGTAYTSQSGTGENWMSTTTTSRGKSKMVGTTTVPFYELIVGSQVTSRQFYGYQDKLAKLIDQIVSQNPRCAFIQVGRSVPIPFVTAEVEEPAWTHAGRRIALNCAYEKNQSGLPLPAIEAQREKRRERISAIVEAYGHRELPAAVKRGAIEAEFEVLEDASPAKLQPKQARLKIPIVEKNPHE
jgi:hypothetical protein